MHFGICFVLASIVVFDLLFRGGWISPLVGGFYGSAGFQLRMLLVQFLHFPILDLSWALEFACCTVSYMVLNFDLGLSSWIMVGYLAGWLWEFTYLLCLPELAISSQEKFCTWLYGLYSTFLVYFGGLCYFEFRFRLTYFWGWLSEGSVRIILFVGSANVWVDLWVYEFGLLCKLWVLVQNRGANLLGLNSWVCLPIVGDFVAHCLCFVTVYGLGCSYDLLSWV
eukprot:gene3100-2082_t